MKSKIGYGRNKDIFFEDVDLDDLNPESLWRFKIRDFGPLLVAMDSEGGSLYDTVRTQTAAQRDRVLAQLGVQP